MELLLLDVRTLALLSCLGGLILAATMGGLYLAGTRQAGLRQWTLAGLFFATGYLVGHLLLTLPGLMPEWLAALLANGLIAAGHGFILLGIQKHLGREPWTGTVLLVLMVYFLAVIFVPEWNDSLQTRIVTHSSLYVIFGFIGAGLLWKSRSPGLTAYRRTVAAIIFGFSFFLLVRLIVALGNADLTDSFVQHPIQILAFLLSTVYGYLLTMALVVMLFREKELGLQFLARHDGLTGLFNRHSLTELAPKAFGQAQRYGTGLSLVMLDLDHFKKLNDRFGHLAGDRVLRDVGRLLLDSVRDSDLVFRTGGEEFLLILPCTDHTEAEATAERLCRAVSALSWEFQGETAQTTASLGAVQVDPETETWEQAVVRADQTLYEAKRAGRNRVLMGGDGPAAGDRRSQTGAESPTLS